MTLTEEAKTTFTEAGLDRDGALLAAKTLGQQIIDDSTSSDMPLEGMIYEVWGLYDEGMPACRFQIPDSDETVVFEAHFRTKNGGALVKRRRALALSDLTALVETARKHRPT